MTKKTLSEEILMEDFVGGFTTEHRRETRESFLRQAIKKVEEKERNEIIEMANESRIDLLKEDLPDNIENFNYNEGLRDLIEKIHSRQKDDSR